MPRRKTEYIEKTVNLHIHKSALTSANQKHQLIITLKHLLGVSPDDISKKLNDAFTKADINVRMPARSSHSTFLKKNRIKSAIKALENSFDIHITVSPNSISEKYQKSGLPLPKGNSLYEKQDIAKKVASSYQTVQVTLTIKSTTFDAWYKVNQHFINELNCLLNDDQKTEANCHEYLLSAFQALSPKPEQHLIKPTRIWFRKNINRVPISSQPRNKPFRATLIAITGNHQDEDNTPSLHLLIKPYDHMGYLPCKLSIAKASNFEANILSDPESKFTIAVTKKEMACAVTIEFSNSHSDTACYGLTLEQEIKDIPKNPFTKKAMFNNQLMWDQSLPDKEYVIIKDYPLKKCAVELTGNRGEKDKRSIEYTMAKLHSYLSIFKWEDRFTLPIPEIAAEVEIPVYRFNDEMIGV
ncbi:hypothetical protein [Photobacterium sanguinicancri]|uniref:Initiator Rep protein domain-containing protein n=1 Tax=Photobacterium sanguinicancri TaxID=875932 RepID=A0ABX4FTB1_9GAMM|nr:hypothetical protein [Photobacterium sanguinicancri]OZS42112.1 hypothetical protein ASV53_20140 [Photobacterium sanguinicancri]